MAEHISDDDVSVRYIAKFREYGLVILDGGTSTQLIEYCPWCGEKFPTSLRDKWFDIVFDDLGLDSTDDPRIPKEMLSDKWWRKKSDSS